MAVRRAVVLRVLAAAGLPRQPLLGACLRVHRDAADRVSVAHLLLVAARAVVLSARRQVFAQQEPRDVLQPAMLEMPLRGAESLAQQAA